MIRKPLNANDTKYLASMLEALKSVPIPPVPSLAVEEYISRATPMRTFQVPTPVSLTVLVCAVGIAAGIAIIPRAYKPKSTGGVPTSCIVQSITGNAIVEEGRWPRSSVPARAGMFIEESTRLKVPEGAEVRIRAGKAVELKVSEQAEVVIDTLKRNIATGDKTMVFKLTTGRLLCRVDRETRPVNVAIETPEARFSVWGTHFEIVRKAGVGSHLGVFEGDVLVEPVNSQRPDISEHVTAGFQTQLLAKKRVSKILVAPLSRSAYPDEVLADLYLDRNQTDQNQDAILKDKNTIRSAGVGAVQHVYEDKAERG